MQVTIAETIKASDEKYNIYLHYWANMIEINEKYTNFYFVAIYSNISGKVDVNLILKSI